MYRDLSKLLSDYENRPRAHKNSNKGAFYISDFEQILDLFGGRAIVEHGLHPITEILLETISGSLTIGYMIGYRTAQRDARGRQLDRDQGRIS